MYFCRKISSATILPDWKNRLHRYITGIVQKNGHKLISINSVYDHLHMFFGMRVDQSLSELMQHVKGDSSEWINSEKLTLNTFRWQGGYGAFSYSRSQISSVCTYIENQEKHHQKITFLDEYVQLLKKFQIEYDDRYLFKPLE